jgi:hypothetical protein
VLLCQIFPFAGIGAHIEQKVLSAVVEVLPVTTPDGPLRWRARRAGCNRESPEQRPLYRGAFLDQTDEVDAFRSIIGRTRDAGRRQNRCGEIHRDPMRVVIDRATPESPELVEPVAVWAVRIEPPTAARP